MFAGHRRGFLRGTLRSALALSGASSLGRVRIAKAVGSSDPPLIIRSRRPLDAETPVSAFTQRLTPNRLFFIRSHFGVPAVAPGNPWRVQIGGGVRMPRAFSIEDLGRLEQVTIPAVLQCSGNGRALFDPIIPGVPWEKGAVGNAEWSGVRLADVLHLVGVNPGQGHVIFEGADGPPNPKTPAYLRSIPLERAAAASTLLALRMNGEPLPLVHGGPVRLVVPGWGGNHWIKWVRGIVLSPEESPSFYQRTAYKMPRTPVPPGTEAKPEDLVSVTTLNVKSLISWPPEGSMLPPGRHEIRGVAWTGGEAVVERVEVVAGTDPNAWQPATLEGDPVPYTWRLWKYSWDAKTPGRVGIRARAYDSTGAVQPEITPWNKSGYLWNGIDRVSCEVR